MRNTISLSITLAVVACTASTQVAAQNAAMNGTWQLNEDKSDDPQQALQRTGASGRLGQTTGRIPNSRVRGGGGGRRSGGGGTISADQRNLMRAAMQRVSRNPARLSFAIGDTIVTIGTGRTEVTLFTDGKAREITAPNGAVLEVKATWDGDKLEVETKAGRAIRIIEEYQLKDDGHVLEVNVNFRNQRADQRARFKRVYDFADPTNDFRSD